MNPRSAIIPVGDEPPPMGEPAEASPEGAEAAPPRRRPGPGRTTGRFDLLNRFVDCSLPGLGRAELAVWLLLWRDTKPDGLARTSQADLARRAGVDPRTIKRAVKSLRADGLLAIVSPGGLRQGPAVYRVVPVAERKSTRE
jgi:hypothetical protein